MREIFWLALLLWVPVAVAVDKPLISKHMNEKVEMIPVGSGFGKAELETTLFTPPGNGPFPLVVINHGKAFGNPKFDPRARYPVASREFLKRGYMVAVPMRPGFSKSEGHYIDTGCNIESNGRLQAESVLGVLNELTKRPEVDRGKILLVGQSHGGLTVLALGAIGFPGVRGILNFAGGFKVTGNFCVWEKSMVDAFEAYGKETKVPSLWFYGDNDSLWGAELPKTAFKAYQAAGVNARLISYGTFPGGDAHGMFGSGRGLDIWWPETEKFLKEIGLPTDMVFDIETIPRPAKSNFAALEDVAAVPYLKEKGRENYAKFLTMPYPRAFAIADTGSHGWSFEGVDPLDTALRNCEKFAKKPCRLYAVDNDVVWQFTP